MVAVRDGDRELTYAALRERSNRLAELLAAGVRPGEHVAVLLGNRLEYPEIAAGVAKAGMAMVTPRNGDAGFGCTSRGTGVPARNNC